MKYVAFIAYGLFLFSIAGCEQAGAEAIKMDLSNAQGEKVGSATLTQEPGGVKIAVQVSNLPPGPHGFHIHAAGKCEPPDFASAGGHFNPQGKKHGVQNPEGPHAGDLPDLVVGQDGTAQMEVVASQVTLESTAANSLLHPEGTALVIHANADDQKTDPAGNAGARIACGVVRK
ncbi:MAG: superoxide dismutase family protein [Candidatus Binatia bacterium]